MTELLHMQDFDVEACQAQIVSVSKTEEGRDDIVLDKTCFYARGGGQDWDAGVITSDNGQFEVSEVRFDKDGEVHHIGTITSCKFEIDDTVSAVVDHDRRTTNTRLHSAGHVIDMAIDSLGLDWVATKGQHYPHLCAVEYSGTWQPEQSDELKTQIEAKANQFIASEIENTIEFMSVDEMKRACKHVPANIPTNKPGRVVMYGQNFGIPCGGTHVKNLKQIGKLHVTKIKHKSGVIRVSYGVGGIN